MKIVNLQELKEMRNGTIACEITGGYASSLFVITGHDNLYGGFYSTIDIIPFPLRDFESGSIITEVTFDITGTTDYAFDKNTEFLVLSRDEALEISNIIMLAVQGLY